MANIISTDQTFSASERNVIAAIAAATIGPEPTRNLPGADDPEIFPALLNQAEHFASRIKQGIAVLDSTRKSAPSFDDDLLGRIDTDPRLRSFSRIMSIVIMQAYYQHPSVLRALGLASRPPFPQGHEVESGDWSLLEPVQQRGSIYRECP